LRCRALAAARDGHHDDVEHLPDAAGASGTSVSMINMAIAG
jgi:hypothetical protein